jgi:hypothetical protein
MSVSSQEQELTLVSDVNNTTEKVAICVGRLCIHYYLSVGIVYKYVDKNRCIFFVLEMSAVYTASK